MLKSELKGNLFFKLFAIVLALVLLLMPVKGNDIVRAASTDTYEPLTVASGFNVDVIAEAMSAYAHSSTSFDDPGTSNKLLYTRNYYSVGGLPNDGRLTSSSTPPVNYQLAPYGGNNCAKLTSSNTTAVLTFDTLGSYSKISLLGASANGDGTFSVQLRYTDNSTTTASFIARDWFNNSGYVISSLGRTDRFSDSVEFQYSTDGPRLYQYQVNADNTKLLKSITGKNNRPRLIWLSMFRLAMKPKRKLKIWLSSRRLCSSSLVNVQTVLKRQVKRLNKCATK